MNNRFGTNRGGARPGTAIALTGILVSLTACTGPFSDELFLTTPGTQAARREIGTLDLADMASRTETPEDVEAAAPIPVEITDDNRWALTIQECRALALQGNLDLKVELLSPTIARESITAEEARFESLFFANARMSKFDSPTSSTLSGSQVDSSSADLGVRVPLRTGGSVTFDLPLSRTETNNVFSTLNPAYTSDFSISISQPLLRGAGVRTNTHGIRIAHLQNAASEARTKLQVLRILSNVDRAYWRLYAAQRELDVRRQEFDLAQAQLDRARRRVEAQVAAEVEIIRAESGVAERLESIIIAENRVRDRERDLKRLLNQPGMGMESSAILVPTSEPNPLHYVLDPEALAATALESRMEMLELEMQLAMDESSVDVARNNVLPLVNLDYQYNVNGLGGDLGDSFDLMTDKSFEDHTLSLRVEVPIGNQAAMSSLRRAVFSRLQNLASKEARQLAIRQEVYNAVDQLEANWQRVLASRQAAILAGRTLEAEGRQFNLGLRTSTDVLDAQARFANAQSSEIRALTEYEIAQIDIAFATGMLLGADRIQWAPAEPEVEINRRRAFRQVLN